jgi:RNA polymerase sigma-70 factor (ECF subfamily)
MSVLENKNADISGGQGKVHYLKDSEEILLALISQKDQVAFEQFYQQYAGRIYALCLRLTGNMAMAEEATQEVFIQVWRKIDTFSGKSTIYTWLHRVATNTTISYLRKQKNWLNKVISTEGNENFSYEESWSPAPDLSRLDKLIMRLPERARLVFVLHAVEGYRHEDIARQLRISTGTSKAQFHRAKNLIKTWLEEDS